MLIAVNFHYIRNDFNTKYPGIFGITPVQFEEQLIRLSKIGEFVSASQIRDNLVNGGPLPDKSILVTFDDGLQEQYNLALPVLNKLGIPAMFYVNTQNLVEPKISPVHKFHLLFANVLFDEIEQQILKYAYQFFGKSALKENNSTALAHYNYDPPQNAIVKYFINFNLDFEEQSKVADELFHHFFPGQEETIWRNLYMDKDQVKKLGEMKYLGSHSHRHIPLGLYQKEIIEKDIQQSSKIIKDITGSYPFSISYPYGSIEASSEQVHKTAAENGFIFGFTMERAGNSNFENPLALARFDCNDLPGGKSALAEDDNFLNFIGSSKWFNKQPA
jgi:peptidoglycan/xylan/chitin deacetylase (PgdA/CDA1 family)